MEDYTLNKKQLLIETISVVLSIILIVVAYILQKSVGDPWYVITLYAFAFAIGGYAKAKEGIHATISNKSLNVEILMILAALGAFIVKNYAEGAILIIIFAVTGVLESYATSRSNKDLTSLLKLAPKTGIIIKNGKEVEVPVEGLTIGDRVIVKVGQQIPVDGTIVDGATSIDQAAITGEFVPVSKGPDEDVFAGSINIESTIIVETKKDPKDSVVQKIINLVQSAQENKTRGQSLIEKIEKYYVYIVILMAIGFMVVPPICGWLTSSEAFYRGTVVLVVGSPCALVASITPAMLASLSNAARKRILVKSGQHFESLIGIDRIIVDKTGTLTTGEPKVARIEILEDLDKDEILSLLMTLENQSNHPLAKAIVEYLDGDVNTFPQKSTEISGRGMEAEYKGATWRIGRFEAVLDPSLEQPYQRCQNLGHSIVNIIKDDQIVGYVALMDTLRPQAKEAIAELKALGVETVLVTGDNENTAAYIAEEAGIDLYVANCFPEDKVKEINKLIGEGHKVMMVGDGINDAPALATADVSVAMGAGTDVSLETADIIFMNNRIENLPKLITLSKRMRVITLQNIIFAVTVIMVLLTSNVFGFIRLPEGVVAHEGSTILVILNSLRLLFK